MDLSGKTILVTGGAVRIGRCICEKLAEAGARVVIHCRHSGHEARELADSLKAGGHPAWVVQEDLDSEAGCEAVIAQAFALAGGLDGLVNNASVFHRRTLTETDLTQMLNVLRPNLFAPMLLIRALTRRSKSGRIVNLLDRRIAALETGSLAYQLSKRALADLTRLAALELAPGFTVNGVAPGPVLLPPDEKGKPRDKAGRIPTGRRPTPEEVAEAVLFLLRADSVTGQIIYVDGGQHLLGNGE
jgi:NAD(P)-dependent dehydrogenase (short-subunit alcohol dehydrogenase family)